MQSALSTNKAVLDLATGMDWTADRKTGLLLSPPQTHSHESIIAFAKAVTSANEMLALKRPSGIHKRGLYPLSFRHTAQDTPAHIFQIAIPEEAVTPFSDALAANLNARRKIQEIRSYLTDARRIPATWGDDIVEARENPSTRQKS